MKKRKIRLRFPRQRSVLSDTLPYEVPPTFSNRHFFEFLSNNEVEFGEDRLQWTCSDDRLDQAMRLLFGIKPATVVGFTQIQQWGKRKSVRYVSTADCQTRTKPFSFRITHKENDARTLTICHPRNQLRVADFYNRYHPLIIYYAGLSPFSLRKPSEIAKVSYFKDRLHFQNLEILPPKAVEQYNEEYEQLGSYFRYRRFNNIHKFFESPIYHRAEMKFDAMLQMDVSKCFDSIYTHSLSWALIGKQATKDDIPASKKTFGGAFDELMQHTNDSETNGIIIGPEFSRIFAELILQSIDVTVERRLLERSEKLEHRRDYDIFRYVDDYFIFYNRDEDGQIITQVLSECLADMKLSVNSSKTVVYRKPIITEITVAKDRISTLFNEFLAGEIKSHNLAAEADDHAADDRMGVARVSAHACGRADPVAHAVHAQLGPAHAPQVGRGGHTVDGGEQGGQLLHPRRHPPMHLADDDGGVIPVERHGPADAAGLVQVDREVVGEDAAHRATPADHAGDGLLVDGVLRRHDVALGRQVGPDQHRGPFGVVGLGGDDGDVDGALLGQALHLRDVHGRHRDRDAFLLGHAGEVQPPAADGLDMLGPWVDQRDVLPRTRQMPAEIAPHRPGTDDRDALAHCPFHRPVVTPDLRHMSTWNRCGRLILRALPDPENTRHAIEAPSARQRRGPRPESPHPSRPGQPLERRTMLNPRSMRRALVGVPSIRASSSRVASRPI